ncbi:MAG TPA: M28 family peptidase [Arachnia sp.]|nr:M28 family peptidase [Arachnia sp.]
MAPTPALEGTPSEADPPEADSLAAAARRHMTELADGVGARYSGTPAERRAGEYIQSAFEDLGYTVETQPFNFWERRSEESSANLVATKQGQSDDVIVVGAHYDSGDEGDGADDNGSGVGVLLAAAEAVRSVDTPYTIQFVAFGAEEADDMFGSAHFVDELDAEARDSIVAMVNIDSVSIGDIPYVYGDAEALLDWARRAADEAGQSMDTVPVRDLHDDADYVAFQQAGIPFIYFEATNWQLGDEDGFTQVDPRHGDEGAIMHTRYDTISYLDETFPGRVDERLGLYSVVVTRILTEYLS